MLQHPISRQNSQTSSALMTPNDIVIPRMIYVKLDYIEFKGLLNILSMYNSPGYFGCFLIKQRSQLWIRQNIHDVVFLVVPWH